MGVPEKIIVLPYVRTYVRKYVRTYVVPFSAVRPAALCCPARYVRAYVRTPTYPCCVRALPGAYVRTYVRTPTYARTYVRTYVSFLRACSLPRTPHVCTYVRAYIRTRVVRSPIHVVERNVRVRSHRIRTYVATVARAVVVRPPEAISNRSDQRSAIQAISHVGFR